MHACWMASGRSLLLRWCGHADAVLLAPVVVGLVLRNQELLRMVILVDSALAGIQMRRRHPLGPAVFAFAGPPPTRSDQPVMRPTRQG
jgi:hypothetical protein